MTALPTLAVDPVVAAALLAGLTEWTATPSTPCPTCGGRGSFCDDHDGTRGLYVDCSDCAGTGHAPLPTGPVRIAIGTTSQEAAEGDFGDCWVEPPRASIVATATAEALPIYDGVRINFKGETPHHVGLVPDDLWVVRGVRLSTIPAAALPWGAWEPGNVAWHLTDLRPVTDPGGCPECGGTPIRPQHDIEGGSVSCRHCRRTFTFNLMRDPGPYRCTCDAARRAACSTCLGDDRIAAPLPWPAPTTPGYVGGGS